MTLWRINNMSPRKLHAFCALCCFAIMLVNKDIEDCRYYQPEQFQTMSPSAPLILHWADAQSSDDAVGRALVMTRIL